jgi:hypothetical protein
MCIVLLCAQLLYPLEARAAANWATPSGSNPMKITAGDFVNPRLLTSVIGCTGVVDLVALASTKLIAKIVAKVIGPGSAAGVSKGIAGTAIGTAATASATANSTAAASATPGWPTADVGLRATSIGTNALLTANLTATNTILAANGASSDVIKIAASTSAAQDAATAAFREECLNGIAVALARTQLEKITRSTLNWVGSGFNGDPLFLKNTNQFMDRLTNTILAKETAYFADPLNKAKYPYGQDWARSSINSSRSAANFDASVAQNLTNYLTPGATVQSFANDFSQGGWGGWLALTQNPQNNPLGFTMLVSQHTADKQEKEKTATAADIQAGGGYASQKKCAVYDITEKRATEKLAILQGNIKDAQTNVALSQAQLTNASRQYPGGGAVVDALNTAYVDAKNQLASAQAALARANVSGNKDCATWETVTPGSAIRDKVAKTLNSPETQLELVRTINDSLNYLFTAILSRFQNQGLSSLVTGPYDDVSGGFTSNDITDGDGNVVAGVNDSGSSGGYSAFDITRDLPAIIKTQKDYIAEANKALSITTGVLPAVGELDYCIPGPNPNWTILSGAVGDANYSAYSDKIEETFSTNSPMQTSGTSAYLAMASRGLAMTRNIPVHKAQTDLEKQDYTEGIDTTKSNIDKLNEIKDQVDEIVAAAKRRRDAQRAKDGLPAYDKACIGQ